MSYIKKHSLRLYKNRPPVSAGIPYCRDGKLLFWLLAELLITVVLRLNEITDKNPQPTKKQQQQQQNPPEF